MHAPRTNYFLAIAVLVWLVGLVWFTVFVVTY